ncbi:type IV pilus biogenesis protein PilM [Pseudomonas aeruginosa]|uniref:type IV pilus biogenesis protein PilM n=1 Tax=Pseudomonas aeruginosa TaxID=287 RepID=UPI0014958C95
MYKATTRPRAPNWPRSIPWPGACCSTAPGWRSTHTPSFSGSPADSALGLPAWFRKPARLQGYIAADTSYAFIASPPAGLAAAVDAGTESDLVGVRRNGQLVTRRLGATAIALPAPIPEGAVVAVK